MTERRIQRRPCANCSGKGFLSYQGFLFYPGETCENCHGQGYLGPSSGTETVCKSCNGHGRIMAKPVCNECKGKGYKVSIYEFTDITYKCIQCGGTGSIQYEIWHSDFYSSHVEKCQEKCPRCCGSGVIKVQEYKTIEEAY